ncbi:MAG: nucleotide exchange factor GrpE [Candidatus Woesearchaeota archaeon]
MSAKERKNESKKQENKAMNEGVAEREQVKSTKQDKEGKNTNQNNKSDDLETLKQQAGEYLQGMQRVQAELENYRKRVDRDRESQAKYATQSFVSQLIPLLENFEHVTKNLKEKDEEVTKGVAMLYEQLWSILKNEGVRIINEVGVTFNPELHEPLFQEESDGKPNVVLEVLQPGYMLHERVIRHARVKISKEKQAKTDKKKEE